MCTQTDANNEDRFIAYHDRKNVIGLDPIIYKHAHDDNINIKMTSTELIINSKKIPKVTSFL